MQKKKYIRQAKLPRDAYNKDLVDAIAEYKAQAKEYREAREKRIKK